MESETTTTHNTSELGTCMISCLLHGCACVMCDACKPGEQGDKEALSDISSVTNLLSSSKVLIARDESPGAIKEYVRLHIPNRDRLQCYLI